MVTKTSILRLGLLCLAVLFAGTAACADAWIQWDGGPQIQLTKVEIPSWERQSPLERYVYQIGSDWYGGYALPFDCAYPQHMTAVGGGDSFLDEFGDPIYVRVGQAVTNVGNGAWTDFHIRAADGGHPYKMFGDWWPAWDLTSVSDGWDYILGEDGIPVFPGLTLENEFWIHVDPEAKAFSLDTWPTVPEPTAVVVFASGLAGMAGGLIRRRTN